MVNLRSIPSVRKLVLGVTFAALLAGQGYAQSAQETADSVVARVDGVAITRAELAFAAEDMAQDLASIPPQNQEAVLVSVLIDMKLMANAARALELDKTDIFAARLQYLEERSLRRAYFTTHVNAAITEEEVRALYDQTVAGQPPTEELHARHILLNSLEDAQAVKAELDAGGDFEEMAREKSTGPSGPNGGDLGFFGRGQMIKEFEDAAYALEIGQVSEPVQTRFGWHIIKLEERRETPPPSFEQVQAQLRDQLIRDRYVQSLQELKQNANVEIVDPELAAAYSASTSGE